MLARIIYETVAVFISPGGMNLTCLHPQWKYFPQNHSVVCDYLPPKADFTGPGGTGPTTPLQARVIKLRLT